jgi:preprotein translocase subunit YajC
VSLLIFLALLAVVMYVLLIRPQRQRQRQHQAMIERAGVGEDILTTGGIYGTVVEADDDDIVVEIAEGVRVHMTRRGVAAVLPPEEEEEEEEEEDVVDAEEPAQELDEAAVTSEEDVESVDAKAAERG